MRQGKAVYANDSTTENENMEASVLLFISKNWNIKIDF